MIQFTTADTEYNITGLSIGTSYMISVVPSVGMCQGEGKELMVDTSTSIPTFQLSRSKSIVFPTIYMSAENTESDDGGNTTLIIVFTIIIVLLIISLVITVVIVWLCVERYHKLKHITSEVKTPVNQQQLNTDTTKMQSSPAYVPVGQDNPISSTVPQYDTVQVSSDHQDVSMMAIVIQLI
ncbi:uncharacterized protein [Dysidea avara]|uniref:uncharacterized protein isoform X2 n=1 Tax=Dysidea avara TaxID=196820 RepID=UPI003316A1C6